MFEFFIKKGKMQVRIAESAEENLGDISPKKASKLIESYEKRLKKLIKKYGREKICFSLAATLDSREDFQEEILMWSDSFTYEEVFDMVESDMSYYE